MSTLRVIKKYPNRRLYDTEKSRYIKLADIKELVLDEVGFIVVDKKTGDDITHLILLQVISDQEHTGEAILSRHFLAQIIRSYGHVAPAFLAEYLEQSLDFFRNQEDKKPLTSGP